jgi:hypothetical protein
MRLITALTWIAFLAFVIGHPDDLGVALAKAQKAYHREISQ